MNELISLLHTALVSSGVLFATYLGVEALATVIVSYCLFANIFVLKTITLCGLTATAADAFTIGATLGLNMLQEYYGKEPTRRTLIANMLVLGIYLFMVLIHLWYAPALADTTHGLYCALLYPIPRIVIASVAVYFCAQQIDYRLYGFLQGHLSTLTASSGFAPSSWLVIRNYGSIIVSQLFDTVAFSFLGLYGLVDNIGSIILVSYTVKLLALFLSTPFLILSRRIMRHS
jgi:uncharacterized integral membrane protein (TIGR00697 family)